MKRRSRSLHPRSRARAAFTLAELLVAMAIIGVLAAITVVSVAGITNDARLATGKNVVVTVLDTARSQAIRRNRVVLVTFRPRLDGENEQFVEAVTAEWRGDAYRTVNNNRVVVYDRFVPIPDIPARALPRGVQVAGPLYGMLADTVYGRARDSVWVTQTHLPSLPREAPGQLVGVMYAPDGSTLTRNPKNDSTAPWVDFDLSGRRYPDLPLPPNPVAPYWDFEEPDSEPQINVVPFIAVYDDQEAREISATDTWNDPARRTLDISDFITQRADRIHFNRYTGVAMQ